MGLCRRGFGLLRCGILALLLRAERKYSFSRVRPGVSSTVFLRILSLVSIGLSIVAFTLDCLVVLTLGLASCWLPLELASCWPPLELMSY